MATAQTLKELVEPVYDASNNVIEAVRTLVKYTEQLQEAVLRGKLPEVQLSEKELADLDDVAREMSEEGQSISLEELNQKHRTKVQG